MNINYSKTDVHGVVSKARTHMIDTAAWLLHHVNVVLYAIFSRSFTLREHRTPGKVNRFLVFRAFFILFRVDVLRLCYTIL